MPQSLASVVVHLVFSTKDRRPWIAAVIRPRLHAYLATVARGAGCECLRVGGVADHVHHAVRISRTISLAELVEEVKTSSTKWIKAQGVARFAWQRGYGVFSVGPRDIGVLLDYVDSQEEHHRKRTFQDEYRAFLVRYGLDYDERYVWD